MPEIQLFRKPGQKITPEQAEAVRAVIFGIIDGVGELGKKRWRRFWNGFLAMEPGEMATITTHKARSGKFHRRHMAIEQAVFDGQQRIEQFEMFRDWLKIGSGFVTWMAGAKGGVIPVPKSISYSELEEGAMREFHESAMAFLRGEHAMKYLWPHLNEQGRAEMMDSILQEFGE
ncbi:hypothetical protein FNL37_1789 [Methylovorus glucosotrophus]|uniref:hypothetical protein n=1 Tax=Methylovorus glucosotrophus TaxID=266009 RepID=UPI00133129A6|nr:hypothetical protein [Methylovorus glucosotrophus]KAF0844345.1 hypothetical protein FNL37_1789 [Methylovorus glucosotrophus]